jgi:hypothetical protein
MIDKKFQHTSDTTSHDSKTQTLNMIIQPHRMSDM